MSSLRTRLILALLGTLADDAMRDVPEPPDKHDPEHGKFCNVNLFKDGKCDCEGPCATPES